MSKQRDLSLNPNTSLIAGVCLYVALVAAIDLPYEWLWRTNSIRMAFDAVGGWHIALLVVVPLVIVAHELLHATCWAIGGSGWKHVHFGVAPKKMMVYAHYAAPLSARVYRIGALMPAVVMGIVPGLAGIVSGNGALAGWGALMLGFASGDLLVVWSIRSLEASALVQDHPENPGCYVL